jgi:hypothetical protein
MMVFNFPEQFEEKVIVEAHVLPHPSLVTSSLCAMLTHALSAATITGKISQI